MPRIDEAERRACVSKLLAVGATDAQAGFHERYGGLVGWYEVRRGNMSATGQTLTEAVDEFCDMVRAAGSVGVSSLHE
jgi:hypothetical protein